MQFDSGSYSGGDTWESNPPRKLLTPRADFEDQKAHQNPSAPMDSIPILTDLAVFSYIFNHFLTHQIYNIKKDRRST